MKLCAVLSLIRYSLHLVAQGMFMVCKIVTNVTQAYIHTLLQPMYQFVHPSAARQVGTASQTSASASFIKLSTGMVCCD